MNPDEPEDHEVDGLFAILDGYTYPMGVEQALQDRVEQVLKHSGVAYLREYSFGDRDRIDFLATKIGVECKVEGGPSAVLSQLLRYMERPEVSSLILVTSRHTHRFSVTELGGKPFRVLWVGGSL